MRFIELLAPARNLECGIEAVRHGADAVYIGAPRFGARAAAGNSIEDIAHLVDFAHPFGVRIYVTVNTLLHDDELPAAQTLINQLADAGVDALIVQDPRIRPSCISNLSSLISPIPLHSSTQMDNRTVDDVHARLRDGYTQTVLARELSLNDIRTIHDAVPEMPLEVFIHGALCVCYSGRCYASEHLFGRSANRGECAQVCRLPFDLIDADNGRIVNCKSVNGKSLHLLSLRDMNRAADIEALMDAGVSSFKIEGRLKDVLYVKNVTAYYRQCIDAIIARRPLDFCRSSFGTSTITFTPDPSKSFNRGFTDYFLHGRTRPMANPATPKSMGLPVGTVKEISVSRTSSSSCLIVDSAVTFANGDGLCYFDADGHLQGFRVNRVDEQGRLWSAEPLPSLPKGTQLFRNLDAAFERQLSRPTAERRIDVMWHMSETPDGFALTLTDEAGRAVSSTFVYPHELARTPQSDNIRRQLSRLGDTIFVATDIRLQLTDNWFIPSSVLAEWRREVIGKLYQSSPYPKPVPVLEWANVPSCQSREERINLQEQTSPLMTCRYCLRHELGACLRSISSDAVRDSASCTLPQHLALRLADGRTFPLRFDCQRCEMQVWGPSGALY